MKNSLSSINYNDWFLTKKVLISILNKNINTGLEGFPKKWRDETLMKKYWITSTKKKFDYAFESNWKLNLIEFDWYLHYTSPKQIVRDSNWRAFENKDVNVIEIPYFIQLSKENINNLFWDIKIDTQFKDIDYSKFPSGFHSDTAKYQWTPAYFCQLWVQRYRKIFQSLLYETQELIMDSLQKIEQEWIEPKEIYFTGTREWDLWFLQTENIN